MPTGMCELKSSPQTGEPGGLLDDPGSRPSSAMGGFWSPIGGVNDASAWTTWRAPGVRARFHQCDPRPG